MTTRGIDYEIGPEYKKAIISNGYTPASGMSEPIKLAETEGKPMDAETIRKSLVMFKEKFVPYKK